MAPWGHLRVIPFGFEPKTYCLEGSCSIQLSYGTLLKDGKGNKSMHIIKISD